MGLGFKRSFVSNLIFFMSNTEQLIKIIFQWFCHSSKPGHPSNWKLFAKKCLTGVIELVHAMKIRMIGLLNILVGPEHL